MIKRQLAAIPLMFGLFTGGPAFAEESISDPDQALTCEEPEKKKDRIQKRRDLHLHGVCGVEDLVEDHKVKSFLLKNEAKIKELFYLVCEDTSKKCPERETIDEVFDHLAQVGQHCGPEILLEEECKWATANKDDSVTVAFTIKVRNSETNQGGLYWVHPDYLNDPFCKRVDTHLHEAVHAILNVGHKKRPKNEWINMFAYAALSICTIESPSTSPQIARFHPNPLGPQPLE